MPLFPSLFGRMMLALIAGTVVGVLFPVFAVAIKPLGDGFIKLLRMSIPAACSAWLCTASMAPAN